MTLLKKNTVYFTIAGPNVQLAEGILRFVINVNQTGIVLFAVTLKQYKYISKTEYMIHKLQYIEDITYRFFETSLL